MLIKTQELIKISHTLKIYVKDYKSIKKHDQYKICALIIYINTMYIAKDLSHQ